MTERENIKRKQKKNHSLKKCSLVSVCFDKIPQKKSPGNRRKKTIIHGLFYCFRPMDRKNGSPLRKKPLQT